MTVYLSDDAHGGHSCQPLPTEASMLPNRPVDLIAKCRCGRTFTPMQWAELDTTNILGGGFRKCPCGLNVKPGIVTAEEK